MALICLPTARSCLLLAQQHVPTTHVPQLGLSHKENYNNPSHKMCLKIVYAKYNSHKKYEAKDREPGACSGSYLCSKICCGGPIATKLFEGTS